MASASDFESWAEPDLVIPLGGQTFRVRPPSVDDAAKVLACAVRGEVNLGIVKGEIPDEVQAVLDTIGPDDHPALGETYQEMKQAGLSPVTIDRFGYYAVFYWARGEEYADTLARLLFTPRVTDNLFPDDGGEASPKD
ncbi:hypothetical protein [Microbacterium sp. UCD-TDU]|uniref:DUF7426 family protein n=1 Tax=Microbacterium sp. UCD-TDU TaxID=1247714 RepID=UPI00034CE12A|nr:hypothetical protein [Microbacterium sp. UCD-TDU]EYT59451.1 hypothetical protein D514_0111655 [Microbacterium sp. UCD-TDU]